VIAPAPGRIDQGEDPVFGNEDVGGAEIVGTRSIAAQVLCNLAKSDTFGRYMTLLATKRSESLPRS